MDHREKMGGETQLPYGLKGNISVNRVSLFIFIECKLLRQSWLDTKTQ